MRTPIFKLLKGYIRQLIELTSGIGLYDHVVEDIEKQKENATPIHERFKKQLADQKHVSQLSLQEQQALGRNELNYRSLIDDMDQGLTTLMTQKWSRDIRSVLAYLEDLRLLVNYALIESDTDIGQHVKIKSLINDKKFKKADYLERIQMVEMILDTLMGDLMEDGVFIDGVPSAESEYIRLSIRSGLGKSLQVLQEDLEYVEINGLPEKHQFEFPEIVEPEIPDAPEESSLKVVHKLNVDKYLQQPSKADVSETADSKPEVVKSEPSSGIDLGVDIGL